MEDRIIQVKSIEQRKSTNGKVWWLVIDHNDRKYGVWEPSVKDGLKAGDTVKVNIEVKGDFTTIKSVDAGEDKDVKLIATEPKQRAVDRSDKTTLDIRKQVALKAAVEFIRTCGECGNISAEHMTVARVLAIAGEFNGWLSE